MSPPVRFTLDSDILVYAADSGEAARQAAAIEIIARAARRDCVLTPQALAEFFHATTRKRIAPRAEAAEQVREWMIVFPLTQGAGEAALAAALVAAVSGRLQFYDALLLATARAARCGAVISEDMGETTSFDGMRIVPAFDPSGAVSAAAMALL